jgi:hypothetical protein
VKVLVVASEPIDAAALRTALEDAPPDDTEVLVVAPALHDSKIRFWMSDDDDAIARAQAVQEESVERLTEGGVDAVGDTGEADPLVAIGDALATFPAERIVVAGHYAGENAYREGGLAEAARERFGLPVEQLLLER